jgi:hypothetical protein
VAALRAPRPSTRPRPCGQAFEVCPPRAIGVLTCGWEGDLTDVTLSELLAFILRSRGAVLVPGCADQPPFEAITGAPRLGDPDRRDHRGAGCRGDSLPSGTACVGRAAPGRHRGHQRPAGISNSLWRFRASMDPSNRASGVGDAFRIPRRRIPRNVEQLRPVHAIRAPSFRPVVAKTYPVVDAAGPVREIDRGHRPWPDRRHPLGDCSSGRDGRADRETR